MTGAPLFRARTHARTHTARTWDEYGICRITGRLPYFLASKSFEYGAKGNNSDPRFYVVRTVHLGMKLHNDQRNAHVFNLFIYLLLPLKMG
jgi:hypothetical protein